MSNATKKSIGGSTRAEPEPGGGAPESPAWEREVSVTELSETDAAVRSWPCCAFGLTRSGLTLRSRPMVHEGRVLAIRIPEAGASEPRQLYGVVKSSSYLMGKGYLLAVEFCAKPTAATADAGGLSAF